MTKTRWVLMTVVVAVCSVVIESILNGVFLGSEYAATAAIWRPMAEMNKLMPYGCISTLISTLLLIYIYHKGYEGKGNKIVEGLRFGLIIGLFSSIPMSVWTYVMFPVTMTIAVGWFIIGMIDMLAAGAIIGALYKRV